jgi:hypothetical protein
LVRNSQIRLIVLVSVVDRNTFYIFAYRSGTNIFG